VKPRRSFALFVLLVLLRVFVCKITGGSRLKARMTTGFLAQEREPPIPQILVLDAFGGTLRGPVGFQDRDFLLRAGTLVRLVVLDVVIVAALVAGETRGRREIGDPAFVALVEPAAVGEIEAIVLGGVIE